MLPQAGVAVGLALTAATVFPDVGPTINAVVLAAIVFFELLGPISTQRAIEKVATCDVVDEIERDIAMVERATVLVPVSYAFSEERLLFLLHMTSAGRPNARFMLTHIVSQDRPVMRNEALRRGQDILDQLAKAGREAGFEVDTRLVASQNIGHALSDLAEELDARLVVIGSGQDRGRIGRSLLKTRMHRILDEVSAPVLVVPESFEPLVRRPATVEIEPEPDDDDEPEPISLEEPPDRPVP
jgi:nucleotide-binding universal stress UspA family protein